MTRFESDVFDFVEATLALFAFANFIVSDCFDFFSSLEITFLASLLLTLLILL